MNFFLRTILLVCLLLPSALFATDDREYSLKAAFVWRFLQFSETVYQSESIRLCVAGDSSVVNAFKALEGKHLNRVPIEVQKVDRLSNVLGCHSLFFSENSRFSVSDFAKTKAKLPVLTVGEQEGFIGSGGMIGFYFEGSRLRFEVNLDAVSQANIKLSSRLLSLARVRS